MVKAKDGFSGAFQMLSTSGKKCKVEVGAVKGVDSTLTATSILVRLPGIDTPLSIPLAQPTPEKANESIGDAK